MKTRIRKRHFGNCRAAGFFLAAVLAVWMTVSPAGAQNWETSPENADWTIFTARDNFNSLAVSDDRQIIWVATNGGLEKRDAYSGELLQVYLPPEGLTGSRIDTLAPDGAGGLWAAGYFGNGLAHLMSDGSLQVFDTANSGLPSNSASTLLPDGAGGPWMSSGAISLAHFLADGTWEVFDRPGVESQFNGPPPHIDYYRVICIALDGFGGVWAGTLGKGMYYLMSDGTWQYFNMDNSGLPAWRPTKPGRWCLNPLMTAGLPTALLTFHPTDRAAYGCSR